MKRLRTAPITEVALWWAVCLALLFVSELLARLGGVWAENAGVLPAGFCLLFPVIIGWRRGIMPESQGLSWSPLLKPVIVAAVACAIVFPFYIAGYEAWARIMSDRPFLGWSRLVPSAWWLVNLVFVQVVAVALPEEVFYRGWMQSRLSSAFSGRVRIFGVPIGWNVVITAALFALSHLVSVPAPFRLAVFFPGLLFGWLREKTGSVVAPVLFHAACNILLAVLQQSH